MDDDDRDFADIVTHPRNNGEQFLVILAMARRAGASIRSLARFADVSKSTMGRWMPVIDALASHLGQHDPESPDNAGFAEAEASHLGHAD
jgi:hypothetical protein